jgi:KaiC/GvpD/RAD55 family RecA-like ATPase
MDPHQIEAQKIMTKLSNKRKTYMESAKPKPISDNYRFSNTGIYLVVGGVGSGKSHFISDHLITTDQKNLYDEIVIIATAKRIDETIETFLKGVKNPNIYKVPEENAIEFLEKLFYAKRRFYSLYRAFMSELADLDEEATRIFSNHRLVQEPRLAKQLHEHDSRNPFSYIFNKFVKNNTFTYPIRTLVIIDDAAGSSLIQSHLSPIVKLMRVCRHLHVTFILAVQTTKGIIKDLKRDVSDIVLFKRVPEEDIENILKIINLPYIDGVKDVKEHVCKLHSELPNVWSKVIINLDGESVRSEH